MAIHVLNPNTIGNQTEAMFNVVSVDGKAFINDFRNSIDSFKGHWKGSDAVTNIGDLAKVYEEIVKLLKEIERLVVDVHNCEIIPMQNNICDNGGECVVAHELSQQLGLVDPIIAVPTETIESWTDPAIISDAETFSGFPTRFENFINSLNEAKNNLFSNWLDSSDRQQVVNVFEELNKNVVNYKASITKVKENLNIVAENKKKLL